MTKNKLKILIVDDNLTFLQLIELALSSDFEVVTASDGKEGLDKVRNVKPDLILLDVMMPHVSGIEMLRTLVSDPDTRDIPVLVITASHFDPSVEMLFKQEPNVRGFFQKPMSVESLKQEISKVI